MLEYFYFLLAKTIFVRKFVLNDVIEVKILIKLLCISRLIQNLFENLGFKQKLGDSLKNIKMQNVFKNLN